MKNWQNRLYKILKNDGIRLFSYVPDAGHKILIDNATKDNTVIAIPLTSEGEGIGIAAGSYLGGSKAVLLMQSSGVGNTVNAIASIVSSCQFPLFMIVTMRGQYGESNPWQMPMGQAVAPVLKSLGMHVFEVETDDEAAEAIEAGLKMAFVSNAAVAILIGQKLIGAKSFIADVAEEIINVDN